MNWRVGPWRENKLLRDKVRNLEEAYQHVKNNQLMYRVMYLEIYRSLQAQQKGCIRLRKRLDKLLKRNHEAT